MRSLLVAFVFSLVGASPAFGIALDTSLKGTPPSGSLFVVQDGGTNRACPLGSVIAGIRHDQGELLCLRIDTERFELGEQELDGPAGAGRRLPLSQWPDTATSAQRTVGYSGPSLHWCGAGRAMQAYNAGINTFSCQTLTARSNAEPPAPLLAMRIDASPQLAGPGHRLTVHRYTDRNNRSQTLHACPEGWALMGLHLDGNIFLCGLVYPPAAAVPLSAIDFADPNRAWMQVGAITTGFTGARPLETFTDELRRLRNIGSLCPSGDIVLRDRFGRSVTVTQGARGGVAVANSSAPFVPVSWACGTLPRLTNCPTGTNTFDVAQYQSGLLLMRCLRRTPAAWTP
jgi:hypothetical protein